MKYKFILFLTGYLKAQFSILGAGVSVLPGPVLGPFRGNRVSIQRTRAQ